MKISVLKLQQKSESEWFAELRVGQTVLSTTLSVQDDGELQSFQIGEPMFEDMLALNGLDGAFSKLFFTFMAKGEPDLPWDFGDQDDEVIERVRKHYGRGSDGNTHERSLDR